MPANSAAQLNALVRHMQASGVLHAGAVAAAFRAVPRHLFLPDRPLEEVYADEAIPTKLGDGYPISSSSQPSMMAIMLEQLALAPGQRVLEIGAGTGYNAALMAHLVGPGGRVVTVDIDDDLVADARRHLAAAGAENVLAVCADGALGYPAEAPYDRVILTVGAWDLAPAWLAQLKPGGRLVLPLALGAGAQKSVAFEKPVTPGPADPLLTSLSLRDCGFMRLRGLMAGPEQLTPLGPEGSLLINLATPLPVAADTVYAWLEAGGRDRRTGCHLAVHDLPGVSFWLGVNEPQVAELIATGDTAAPSPLPSLYEYGSPRPSRLNLGLLTAAGLGLLWLPAASPLTLDQANTPRELMARAFGPPSAEAVTERLAFHIGRWLAAGKPGSEGMRVRAFPLGKGHASPTGGIVVEKPHCRLVIDWHNAAD